MPKASSNVLSTDLQLRAASTSGSRTDFRIRGAPGLQLRVSTSGTKTWALAYKSPLTGKWAKIALGKYDEIGLTAAKNLAGDLAAEIRKGHDPIYVKRSKAFVETFESLAKRYMHEHEARNARAGKPSRSTLEAQRQLNRDILPALGNIRAELVARTHVMQVVETIADRGAYVTADRALGLIRAIYNWACGTGRLDHNPTLGLRKRKSGRPRKRVLSTDEICIFWKLAESLETISVSVRLALQLQLVTGARIGEVIGAPRTEFDLHRGLWTIAGIRTKSAREHVLPLPMLARRIVAEAIRHGDEAEMRRAARAGRKPKRILWVFARPKGGGAMEPHAASRALVREREAFTRAGIGAHFNTHDLRRTLATKLGEMEVDDRLIDRILNHAPISVAAKHYNHARYLEPMRIALDAWAARIESVVGIHAAGPALYNLGKS